jgi:transcriptional regulator with XRE-family HTH domain
MATLRMLRKQALLSMEELATAVGVKRQAVWEWEKGVSQPRPVHQRKLVAALKISPAELLQALEETAKENQKEQPDA